MRLSHYFLPTLRETPTEAEIISHRLMLRAGMIRRLAAGLYSWLPLGLRVQQQVEKIVREEMTAAGAQELLMPIVQPAELWRESGRWDSFGPELLRFKDRHNRDFALGPTHEEVITDLVRREVHSYRQLPFNLYQIQTKFRDETRPRFGVMRAREFTMKDGYSFEADEDSLDRTYRIMFEAYGRIFSRLGLDFRAVEARTGAMGGTVSHEFHVLADSGEDDLVYCDKCGYAANVELAELPSPSGARSPPEQALRLVDTPGAYTIATVSQALGIEAHCTVKTLFVHGQNGPVALILRGDHELNENKASTHPALGADWRFMEPAEITQLTGAHPGSIGPVGLDPDRITVLADQYAAVLVDFVCGANRDDQHLRGVNWGRDLPEPVSGDLRLATAGDPCPHCESPLESAHGIEVGHIFKLGTKYSEALATSYLDSAGREQPLLMGCYGIGISRVVAAAIEQNHDDQGISWPDAIAPFELILVPINKKKSHRVAQTAEALYGDLLAEGFDVLYDDREERPGVRLNDADLIGVPHRLVIGDKGLDKGVIEYKARAAEATEEIPVDRIQAFLRGQWDKNGAAGE